MRVAIAVALLLGASLPSAAQEKLRVATTDVSTNVLTTLELTFPVSGTPTVAVSKKTNLATGPAYLAHNGNYVYVSCIGGSVVIEVDRATGTIASQQFTTSPPRNLAAVNSTCLVVGAGGTPALSASTLPSLALTAMSSPAASSVQDVAVSQNAAVVASVLRVVSSPDRPEAHLLNIATCPPTLTKTVSLSLGAAYSAFLITPTKALASLVGGAAELYFVDFTSGTMSPAGITGLSPKPRTIRALRGVTDRLSVLHQGGNVSIVDLSTSPLSVVAVLATGPDPSAVVVDSTGKWLVVFDGSQGKARVFRVSGGTVVAPQSPVVVNLPVAKVTAAVTID